MIIINANSFSPAPDFLISPYDATVTALYVICFCIFSYTFLECLFNLSCFVSMVSLQITSLSHERHVRFSTWTSAVLLLITLSWESHIFSAVPLPKPPQPHTITLNALLFLTWTLRSYCQSISCVIHFMFLTGPIADHILKGLVIFMLSTWTPQSIANYTLLARDIFLPYI